MDLHMPDLEHLQRLIAEAGETLPHADPRRLDDIERRLPVTVDRPRPSPPRWRFTVAWWVVGLWAAAASAAGWWGVHVLWQDRAAPSDITITAPGSPGLQDNPPAAPDTATRQPAESPRDGRKAAPVSPHPSSPLIYQREQR